MFSRFFLNLLFPSLSVVGWWFAWRATGHGKAIVLVWAAFAPVALWTLLAAIDGQFRVRGNGSWLGFSRLPAGLAAAMAICVAATAQLPRPELLMFGGIGYGCVVLADPFRASFTRLEFLAPVWVAAYLVAAHFLFPAGLLPEHIVMLR